MPKSNLKITFVIFSVIFLEQNHFRSIHFTESRIEKYSPHNFYCIYCMSQETFYGKIIKSLELMLF